MEGGCVQMTLGREQGQATQTHTHCTKKKTSPINWRGTKIINQPFQRRKKNTSK